MKKQYEDIKNKYNNVYLFKRDINGNVIYWKANVNTALMGIFFYHGRIHSSFLEDNEKSGRYITVGKNIGKSNETTIEEQCYKELESEYKDHIKKGYKDYKTLSYDTQYLDNIVDKTNTDVNGLAKPMKAQKFEPNKMEYPVIGQPKINGVRCIAFKNKFSKDLFTEKSVTFLSKEGVEYKIDHLNDIVYKALEILEYRNIINPIIDGEIYIPDTPVTTIGGSARNPLNPYHKKLQFVAFDLSIENFSQLERINALNSITNYNYDIKLHSNHYSNPTMYILPSILIYDDNGALHLLDDCLQKGYEGAIVREQEPEYAFGQRPRSMRKLKKFQDAEFEILDIIQYGDGTQKVGTGCKLICKNDLTDDSFEVTPLGTTEYRLSLIADKDNIIGKKATIKFYERTINKLPFHANVIAIRDYE